MVKLGKCKILLAASVIGLGTIGYMPLTSYAESTTEIQTVQESNLLSNLEIEGLKLDQTFSPSVKVYTATVENEVQEITMLLTSNVSSAQIIVNGKSAGNGTSGTYSLKTGKNIFLITVKNGTSNSSTYKLTITRKQNANNSLKNIELSNGVLSPHFSPSVTSYNIEGLTDKTKIKVIPTAAEKTATMKVNNKLVTTNGITVDIPVGESTIRITVTAENGASKTYTLHSKRSENNDKTPDKSNPGTSDGTKPATGSSPNTNQNKGSQQNNQKGTVAASTQKSGTTTSSTVQKTSKAMLSALTVSTGTWDSSFDKEEFTYHITVAKGTEKVTISPTAAYSSSTIKIEGDTKKTIKLEDDDKTVISLVVNYDDDDRKTYVLVFDKK
ncbi:cadherin-like beta sandwich domain-containing protein [Bacillus rubiinfantis]|uniref:cadherin-like beta sandwich domain-containing protein n=1 Tax=Bacillus rubiinfantis TaxID=1499680 RepID=UPI0005A82A52|nr:cadherin-like beta sandwich domain-containing protein [Bacillus rubiinfantis]